jgi:PAS domain S-box-containing protein
MDPVPVLIVDDRQENLVAIEAILMGRGYQLVVASSGDAALHAVLQHEFAALLIDVRMPGMDGFELATLIKQRKRSRHTPIIFLTASAPDLEHIYRGYSVGAVDYMTKPLDADVLRAKVEIFAELLRKDRRIRAQAEALRVASERELAAIHAQRYRNLAEAIPQIVWTAAPDGAITYFNERWVHLTGQPQENALGWGWLEMVAPEDAARVTQSWREGVRVGNIFELECRLHARWHLCRAVPELVGGEIVAWLGTFTDFDELHRARDAAECSVRARDEFLSIASHELRTPLTTLQLRLQSLRREVTSPKLDSSLRQAQRLIALVDNLLDVSRLDSGQLVLRCESFDLVAATRELVGRFVEVASTAHVALEVRADAPIEGSWDRVRVEQIVENLVGNALKYAANAPIEVEVSADDAVARVTVRDHGPGISVEDQARIFEPFERATSSRNYGGLGLGLFIARRYAEAHGGRLLLDSTSGEGATFVVELAR